VYQLRENASEARGLAPRRVAGAVAPAPVLGLSKSHIRPLPTVTFYVGGSLVRFDSCEVGDRTEACPKRSDISEFSEKSKWKARLAKGALSTGAARKKAIVALARQLAVDLWRVRTGRLSHEQLGLEI